MIGYFNHQCSSKYININDWLKSYVDEVRKGIRPS